MTEQGARPLSDLEFIHEGDLNLYVYPEAADYTDARPLNPAWHRLDSSVRETEEPFTLPPALADRDGALNLLQPRLARLGRRGPHAQRHRLTRPDPAPLHRLQGPGARGDRTGSEHVGRGVPAADPDPSAGRSRHHPRRQQHDHRGPPLRQAHDPAAAVLGPARQRPAHGRTGLRHPPRSVPLHRRPTPRRDRRSSGRHVPATQAHRHRRDDPLVRRAAHGGGPDRGAAG